jgi:hypothetical protein
LARQRTTALKRWMQGEIDDGLAALSLKKLGFRHWPPLQHFANLTIEFRSTYSND